MPVIILLWTGPQQPRY